MSPNRTSKKIACDACHARKIQCDAPEKDEEKRPCDWCRYHKMVCTFNRVRGRRKNTNKKSTDTSDVAERLARIEEALALGHFATRIADPSETGSKSSPPSSSVSTVKQTATLTSGSQSPHSTLIYPPYQNQPQNQQLQPQHQPQQRSPDTQTFTSPPAMYARDSPSAATSASGTFTSASHAQESYAQIHYAGAHLGHLNARDGTPLFSPQGERWIYSRTGEVPIFSSRPQIYRSNTAVLLNGDTNLSSVKLPPRHVVDVAVDVWANSPFRLAFPLIDMVLFEQTVQIAYDSELPGAERLPELRSETSKACVWAFLSISNYAFQNHGKAPIQDIDECSIKAQHFLTDILQCMTVTALQTLLMLFIHQLFSGRFQPATMFHALATRTVFALGGHRNVAKSSSFANQDEYSIRTARHVRNLFWLTHLFDKDIALRMGQPPIISDEDCDLTFPEGYEEQQTALLQNVELCTREILDTLVPHMPVDLRLNLIKAKICRLLYSPSALKNSDAELIRSIRELDLELEHWRQNMPRVVRPTLSGSRETNIFPQPDKSISMYRVIMYLEYLYLLAAIHRASGRCRMRPEGELQEGEEGLMIYGVTSSIQLSVEASRSTIIFMRTVMHEVPEGVFWVVVFYPMSAIITLFCSILIEPLGSSSREDLELLHGAADMVKAMPTRKVNSEIASHVKSVEDFIDELIRMANCAVAKAERETRGMDTEDYMDLQ